MPTLSKTLGSSCLLVAFGATLLAAQSRTPLLAQRRAVAAPSAEQPDSVLVRSLTFRSIGPALMGGRIADIAVAQNPASVRGGRLGTVIYIGAATGGVYKSINGGVSWTPVFDSVRTGGVGAVAVAPSNSDIVWVGTGEAQNMRSSSYGTGVYKSTDGGKSWSAAMLPGSQHIGRIVIDPRDPNVVYVAAAGPLWAPGGERGLYKTTDGGRTWTNTKNISKYTGFIDVAIDPSDPDVLYAAAFERERREYGFLPAGPESALYKTTDAGAHWSKLTQGLPSGEIGRIGVSVCASKPSTVYAVFHARGDTNGVYRTDDAGASWRLVSNNNGTAWYYGQVRCDPTDPEHVVKLNVGSQESFDGGRTWSGFGTGGVHSDHHALWINPETPEQEILGNDGGLYFTWDRGRTWDHLENFVASQFYAIATDDSWPFYNVFGGLQDNSAYGGPSRTRNSYGPTNAEWYRLVGGDGFYAVPDPADANIVYAESQDGGVVRYDARTGQSKNIRPPDAVGEKHRYNWSTPILPSRHEPRTIYLAANYLFKSTDRGDDWVHLGGDLTRNIDGKTLPMRGSVPDSNALGRDEGTAEFGNITTIDESPMRAGLLAVGTDDGLVQVSRDGGRSWQKTEHFPGVPDTTYVSRVIFSSANEGTVYATFDGHRSNDFKPYVMRSTDYGQSWTAITGDLPAMGSVQVIREHPRQPKLLFVGTEFGVFFSIEGGNHWTQLTSGIPGVPVWDLTIQSRANDLVVGTHGRGIFILDDIGPLEHLAEAKAATAAYLFPVRDALYFQPNGTRSSGMTGTGFTGQNPPPGAQLAYLVRDLPADTRIELGIVDATGAVVRALPAERKPGLYRVMWDMRVGAPLTGPIEASDTATATAGGGRGGRGGRGGGGGFGGGFGGRGGGNAAATFLAVPGRYKVRLTLTPKTGTPTISEQSFALVKDPMIPMTDAELRTLYAFRLDLTRFQRDLRDAQGKADTVQRSLADIQRIVDTAKAVPASTKDAIAAMRKDVAAVVMQIGGAGGRGGRGGGGGGRGGRGGGGDLPPETPPPDPATPTIQRSVGMMTDLLNVFFAPSPTELRTLKGLPAELRAQVEQLDRIRTQRLPAAVQQLGAAGIVVPH